MTKKVIPEKVRRAAEVLVSRKMGRKFFARHLTLDSASSVYYSDVGHLPYWALLYRMQIPSKSWVQGSIQVHVDSTGALLPAVPGLLWVCDCVHHPKECTFGVDEQTAVGAAKRAGFKAGLRPWQVKFQWVARVPIPCYEWVIENTLYLAADSCSASGETIVIGASSGRVLAMEMWSRICCFASPPLKIKPIPLHLDVDEPTR